MHPLAVSEPTALENYLLSSGARTLPRAYTAAERLARFGPPSFFPQPLPDNPEHIEVPSTWEQQNLVTITLPQLATLPGCPPNTAITFHRDAASALQALWQAWETAGLLSHVLSWDGTYVPRFIRGKTGVVSSHASGIAFDINAAYNPLWQPPTPPGQPGSVYELVPLARKHGFVWGGTFPHRRDGMHFELGHW